MEERQPENITQETRKNTPHCHQQRGHNEQRPATITEGTEMQQQRQDEKHMEENPPENLTEETRENNTHDYQKQGPGEQGCMEENPPENLIEETRERKPYRHQKWGQMSRDI